MTDPSPLDPMPYDDGFAAVTDLDPTSWAVLDAEAAVQTVRVLRSPVPHP